VSAGRAVIFDFDGTLFRLGTDYPALRRALAERLPEIFAGTSGGGAAASLASYLASSTRPQREPILALLATHEAEGVDRGGFFPDARQLLQALHQRGVPFAIYTRNCRATIDAAFGGEDLPRPAALVGIDDDVPPKPDPRATRLLLDRLGVAANRCVMVGDTSHDMAVGRDLGIPRVLRRNPQLARVPADQADVVVDSFADLDLGWLLG
jgi:HAD superfamily hydrolase (TIGR01509 family)